MALARRSVLVTSARNSGDSGTMKMPHPVEGKLDEKRSMPDDLGYSAGERRYELLEKLAGNKDPFDVQVTVIEGSSRENPSLVPSMFGERLVGCICEEDSVEVRWMTLFEGEAKRCGCGKWFKLVTVSPEHPHLDQKLQ